MFRKAIFPLGGEILLEKVSVTGERWHGISVAGVQDRILGCE
jgi:hypothetical protein